MSRNTSKVPFFSLLFSSRRFHGIESCWKVCSVIVIKKVSKSTPQKTPQHHIVVRAPPLHKSDEVMNC